MEFRYYTLLVKTLSNFIILPVISLVNFFENLRTVVYREFNQLNDTSKEIELHINLNILKNIQSVQIIYKILILDKPLIFCNSEFELSLKIEQKNQININSLFYIFLPLKQFRKVI